VPLTAATATASEPVPPLVVRMVPVALRVLTQPTMPLTAVPGLQMTFAPPFTATLTVATVPAVTPTANVEVADTGSAATRNARVAAHADEHPRSTSRTMPGSYPNGVPVPSVAWSSHEGAATGGAAAASS